MTAFNKKTKTNKTVNHEGAVAYNMSAALELYSLVVTSSLSNTFYESKDDRVRRLRELVDKNDPVFVAKLAVYAREEMNLRSIPLVLLVELAKTHNGDSLVSNTLARVIQRADELTEVLAYYCQANDIKTDKLRNVSKQIEKGVAKAFNKFNEYQFAKYDRASAISLKDALFKTHPKPLNEDQVVVFKKIVDGTLDTPFTWETELSAKGNTAEVWNGLIDSKKVGYMALLRNLRNIVESGVDNARIETVTNYLSSPEAVKTSRQLPFRFLSAYRELLKNTSPSTSMILEALDKAIIASVENVKGFDSSQTIAIACDVSGSMQTAVSEKSTVQQFDIGLVLGMILQHKCKSVVSGMFGNTFKIINLPKSSILQNVMEFHRREGEVGYSTNGHLVLDGLIKSNVHADKVMMFTDCQMWNSTGSSSSMRIAWNEYKKVNPAAKLYLFDLAGHGNTPVSLEGQDVYLIAGWSDKVFDVLEAYESGSSALNKINEIVI